MEKRAVKHSCRAEYSRTDDLSWLMNLLTVTAPPLMFSHYALRVSGGSRSCFWFKRNSYSSPTIAPIDNMTKLQKVSSFFYEFFRLHTVDLDK